MNHPKPIASPPRCILRLHDVEKRVGLKKSRIYELILREEFPQPVSIAERAVGWDSYKIDAWVDARLDVGQGS